MKAFLAAVMALTLASVALPASADEPAPTPAPAPAQAPEAEPRAEAPATPLATRPSKPLALAPTNEGTPFGYKLLLGIGVATAAGLWLRKRRGVRPTAPTSRIDILSRRSVGVRSELLVIEVEGTRLLVGMTPGAVQSLAGLDGPSEPVGETTSAREDEEADDAPRPMLQVADRARALLGELRVDPKPASGSALTSSATPRAAQAKSAKLTRVEGQAKGLLLALEPPPAAADEAPARKTRRIARPVEG